MDTLAELGLWNCMILAAILFVLEITAPGMFSWQWQLVWFCLLSVTFVVLAWKYLRKYPLESEQPLLNERAVKHIGEQHALIDPIVNGRGSVKIGDSVWRVTGPELPLGAQVRVIGADGTLLKVVPAAAAAAA